MEVGFTESAATPIFTVGHIPPKPQASVVICPPILGEALVAYRREFNLAARLAATGIAVQRFQYRGTGHSEGSETDITFEGMVEDALSALRLLEERVGPQRVAFLGTRWGALVAAACAQRVGGAPLVLWDPVPDPGSFLNEAIRARVMRRLKKGQGRRTTMAQEMAELDDRGWLDILGYRLPRSLVATTNDDRLPRSPVAGNAPVLTVVFNGRGGRPPIRLGSSRVPNEPVGEVVTIDDEVPIWFSGRSTQGSERLMATTTRWLKESLLKERSLC